MLTKLQDSTQSLKKGQSTLPLSSIDYGQPYFPITAAKNPYQQLKNAKDSFAHMINVINQSMNASSLDQIPPNKQPSDILPHSQTYITQVDGLGNPLLNTTESKDK